MKQQNSRAFDVNASEENPDVNPHPPKKDPLFPEVHPEENPDAIPTGVPEISPKTEPNIQPKKDPDFIPQEEPFEIPPDKEPIFSGQIMSAYPSV